MTTVRCCRSWHFVPLFGAMLSLLAVIVAPRAAAARYNIVVIMTDDQRDDTLHVMPNVDTLLAKEGMTFLEAFSSNPLCCPARASFLTGQFGHNNKVMDNGGEVGGYSRLDHTQTLPVWLQNAGYHTVHIGKYLNGYNAKKSIPPGWTEWYGSIDPSTYKYYGYTLNENDTLVRYGRGAANYQTDVYARKAVDVIRRQQGRTAPFFLSVAFLAPHDQKRSVPGPPGPPPAPRHDGAFATLPLPTSPSFNEADVVDKPALIRALAPLTDTNIADLTTHYRRYLGSLLAVDEAVKSIVDALAATGQLQNTVIIFLSDNGFLLGEHRINQTKIHPYEESIRIPLIIRHPDFPGQRLDTHLVAMIDLAPTILDIASASATLTMDGQSLLPLIHASQPAWRNYLLLEADHREPGNTIQYVGIRSTNDVYLEHHTGEQEFYRLFGSTACTGEDPYQLSSQHTSSCDALRIQDLKVKLTTLKSCAGATCWSAER